MQQSKTSSKHSFLCSWSGGKDSYLACFRSIQLGNTAKVLLNNLNEEAVYSRSHRIPKALLQVQAQSLNLPIEFNVTSWEDYELNFVQKLNYLKSKYDLSAAVYGDIDIESHLEWEKKVSKKANLNALLPLWQENRLTLVEEMIDLGMKPLIVSCQSQYASRIIGRVIDRDMLMVFEELGIDACGENGEYHTLVN